MGTLQEILNGADDKEALIVPKWEHSHLRMTYGELRQTIRQFQRYLRSRFTTLQHTIAIILPNSCEVVISLFAVTCLRWIAAPLHPKCTREELIMYLKGVKADSILTSPSINVAVIEEVSKFLNIPIMFLSYDVDRNCTPHCSSLLLDGQILPEEIEITCSISAIAAPSDIAIALHTTGSTGAPKVVLLTHQNMYVSSQNTIESYQLNEADRCLIVMPLFHVHGLIGCLLSTLASGGTVVLPLLFSATAFWPICVAHQCTWYSAVPTLHIMLLERERKQPSSLIRNHQLRFIRSSSSYLAPSVCLYIENAFQVPVLQAYGMTEASHQVTTNQLHACKKGSVGRAIGSVQIAIWHSDAVTYRPNLIGEVLVRGETVMYGYRDVLPSSTGFTKEDCWFKTGDIGYIDSEGFLFLQGRSKHMINRGGEKISPLEVTSVLLSHPNVNDAVVFAFPHPIYGESVHAAVVSSSPSLTESELIYYCQSRLATFKCPEQIHFLDQLPQTVTGKIHLPLLIQQLQSSKL